MIINTLIYAFYINTQDVTRISKDKNGLVYYTAPDTGRMLIACDYETTDAVVIPDDVVSIGFRAFYNHRQITSIVIGAGCKEIGNNAFRSCYGLRSLIMGDNVEIIQDGAFTGSGEMRWIVFGAGVKKVGNGAFVKSTSYKYTEDFKYLYFHGTAEEYSAIQWSANNDDLLNKATICFYSETEPTKGGNYWYYKNGTPTLWNKN